MIVWLLACTAVDADLARNREALDAWRAGERALDASDPATAVAAFERAETLQPGDVLLSAWRAKAHADAGDLQGAVDRLEEVLVRAPNFDEARYNRAAYLARQGEVAAAGAELSRALDGGMLRARDAMRDADFKPHLRHPAFSFLPAQMLMVAVDTPTESVFWGSEATVRLRVVGADGAKVALKTSTFSGPVALVGVVEDVVESTDGPVRDLTYTLKVLGEGEVVVGPVLVQSDGYETTVGPIRFPTTAPPGKGPPENRAPLELVIPSDLRAGLSLPGARRVGRRVEVLARGLDRTSVVPASELAPLRYELRDRSRTQWVLHAYEAPTSVQVTVRRGGETVLEGTF